MSASAFQDLLERICAAVDDPRPVPRTVVVVAHPDDETIGAGARLPRLRDAVFVHVTDGAPRNMRDALAAGFATREEYVAARRGELLAALSLAGIGPGQTQSLGVADQEASLCLGELVQRLAGILCELRPEVVLTHPYEGGHPDHDATALAVHAAVRLLEEAVEPPVIVEMASYHNGSGRTTFGEFLPDPGCEEIVVPLLQPEQAFKRKLLDCYTTQHVTLIQFPIEAERFRLPPRYDFTRPPHLGRLFYEHFDWGMTGERWRRSAVQFFGTLAGGKGSGRSNFNFAPPR